MTLIERLIPGLRPPPEPEAELVLSVGDQIRVAQANYLAACRDLGIEPRSDAETSGLGGYRADPPAAARTVEQVSADHDAFVLDILRGAQFAEREVW